MSKNVQYTSVAQDEGEKSSGKRRGDEDESSLNKRMPFCIGMCVHRARASACARVASLRFGAR